MLVAAAAFSTAGLALASATAIVRSSANETLHQKVVVDQRGRTVYILSPETTRHLLCRTRTCLQLWPPVTVRSRSTKLQAGPGVQGHLGLLRRSNGVLQVTLRGMPMYRYSGDTSSGEANGEGIKGFGGTWHALRASSAQGTSPPMQSTAPATPAPAPPSYGY